MRREQGLDLNLGLLAAGLDGHQAEAVDDHQAGAEVEAAVEVVVEAVEVQEEVVAVADHQAPVLMTTCRLVSRHSKRTNPSRSSVRMYIPCFAQI